MTKMWGGRFSGELDPFFAGFNRSISFDIELAGADVVVNRTWADALAKAGVLSSSENDLIQDAFDELEEEWSEEGMDVDFEAEDVHSFLEQQLATKVGDLAKKLHTGRSRNDQVAADLKLFLRERLTELVLHTDNLCRALVALAEKHADVPIPGYTHLQRAQPITVGHHALAYVEMLHRDRLRLLHAWQRMGTCPLGSGALAGTAFPVDREALAEALHFEEGPTRNSLDAVSDRDHVCETVFACSLVMSHLSRLAEDWIFFCSHEAGFLTFDDAVSTGSSLMPQKRNPDAMELLRGKAGRVCGALQTLMMTLKGLPLAYNKDLQEDKEALLDALQTTFSCLRVATTAVHSATFDVERCRAACEQGYLNATDLADLLVAAGVPFRDAHARVGHVVSHAIELGVELHELPESARKELLPELSGNLSELLSVDAVLARRKAIGGTAPMRVRQEVRAWKDRLAQWELEDDMNDIEEDES